jgi:hypothetical protein
VLEQFLKAERKRDSPRMACKRMADRDVEQETPAKTNRGAAAAEEDSEPEASATPKSDASSSDTAPFDGSKIVQLLQQLAGNALAGNALAGSAPGAGPAPAAGAGPEPADPRAAERARLAAEKEAKKAEKKEAAAVQRAADLEKRKATQDVGLAARVQVLLTPVAEALKAIEIKDDLEAVVKEPLVLAKANIAKYMKEAAAMQASAKKKGFGSDGHRLSWTQKDVSTAITSAKDAMKKHEQFIRMFHT